MFLRASDGTKYVNSERLAVLKAVDESGWKLKGDTTVGGSGVTLATFASQSAARTARDKLVAVLRGTSEGDAFLAHYEGDILYPSQAIELLTTFNGGAGAWQVRADGNNLAVNLADQAAATASMDAIAAAVGAIDVAELVA